MLGLARGLVAACSLGGVAGAGAVDQDALLAVGGAGLFEAGVHIRVGGDVDLAEDAADFACDLLALLFVHVEQSDLHPLRGEGSGGGLAEAGGAAGDDGGHGGIEFHGRFPVLSC